MTRSLGRHRSRLTSRQRRAYARVLGIVPAKVIIEFDETVMRAHRRDRVFVEQHFGKRDLFDIDADPRNRDWLCSVRARRLRKRSR